MSQSNIGAKRPSRAARLREVVFDVSLAQEALPLVRRIVADIARHKRELNQLQVDRRLLEEGAARKRFVLDDAIRERRGELRSAIDELHAVGVTLLDPLRGEVGFPTLVNGSLAYLVYRAESDAIGMWRYRDQNKLRPIPAHWAKAPVVSRLEEEEGLLV